MPDVIFDDRAQQPDDKALSPVLGPAKPCWDRILQHLESTYPDLLVEWKFYGKKHGWQLKVSRKKRSVLYMIPDRDSFRTGMALKGKAVQALQESTLPPAFIQQVMDEGDVPEGRPARLVVRETAQVEIVEGLLAITLGG